MAGRKDIHPNHTGKGSQQAVRGPGRAADEVAETNRSHRHEDYLARRAREPLARPPTRAVQFLHPLVTGL